MSCTSVRCGHSKIPYGGHCAFIECPNYRRKCYVHEFYPPQEDKEMDKAALSEAAQARMTQMLKEVLEPAMKAQAQRNPDDFVYTAPEVWMEQVMNVGARIVNRALTIAHAEWSEDEGVEEAHVCVHPSYNAAGNCAEIACDNYAGKHVRTVDHKGEKPTLEDIQRDNEVRWQTGPSHIDRVLGN